MKKRFISSITAVVLFLSGIYIASAEETIQKEGIFTYSVSGNNAVITAVDDSPEAVTVPEKINGYKVTEIADGAFGGNAQTPEVYIPDTVEKIGSMCFAYSTGIKKVRLSRSIKTIEDGTFYQCSSLIGITIPDGVESIGSRAFGRCVNLVSVAVPSSVTYISDNAFEEDSAIRIHCRLDESCPAYYWALARNIECEELVKVYVNGTEIDFDQSPITEPKKFRTLVPIRSVLEYMGAEIDWYSDIEYAGITINGYRLLIKPESDFMMVNGKVSYMTCPAIEYNGRILLPIRDVVQAIGGKVGWDENTKVVTITYN